MSRTRRAKLRLGAGKHNQRRWRVTATTTPGGTVVTVSEAHPRAVPWRRTGEVSHIVADARQADRLAMRIWVAGIVARMDVQGRREATRALLGEAVATGRQARALGLPPMVRAAWCRRGAPPAGMAILIMLRREYAALLDEARRDLAAARQESGRGCLTTLPERVLQP